MEEWTSTQKLILGLLLRYIGGTHPHGKTYNIGSMIARKITPPMV